MKSASLALVLAVSAFSETSHAQGPLTPPSGVPAPVMKTLDQIEPRTPIPPSPAVPVAGPHFTITQPGSYYLTGNVTVSSGDGILIDSSDVTLDLNGFSISSTKTGGDLSSSAVFVSGSPRENITVKNGFVRSGSIISSGVLQANGFSSGINLNNTRDPAMVSDISVAGVSGIAIFIDFYGIVRNCSVTDSGGGIAASNISDCRISSAINRAIEGDIITNCYARSINQEAIFSRGTVTSCRATSTSGASAINCSGTVSFSRAQRNGGVAIQAGIAVACTVDGTGTVSSPQKHLGTP